EFPSLFQDVDVVFGFRKATWLDVSKFVSIEMVRDGGSFAFKFQGREGNQYILFTKIRFGDVVPTKEDQRAILRKKRWSPTISRSSLPVIRPSGRRIQRPTFIANCAARKAGLTKHSKRVDVWLTCFT